MHGHEHARRDTRPRRLRNLVCATCGGILGNHKPWCTG